MTASGCAGVAMLLAISLGAVSAAPAQEPPALVSLTGLRLEWTVEGAPPGPGRLAGYLYNDNIMDAAHVWLRVDELTRGGAVSSAHRRRLVGDVYSRGRMAFDVAVSRSAASYRVVVESVDWVKECR